MWRGRCDIGHFPDSRDSVVQRTGMRSVFWWILARALPILSAAAEQVPSGSPGPSQPADVDFNRLKSRMIGEMLLKVRQTRRSPSTTREWLRFENHFPYCRSSTSTTAASVSVETAFRSSTSASTERWCKFFSLTSLIENPTVSTNLMQEFIGYNL